MRTSEQTALEKVIFDQVGIYGDSLSYRFEQNTISLFAKPFAKRTLEESQQVIKILSQIPKLRTFVNENTDFQKFLKHFAEFLEFQFVPKGSAVFHFGEPGEEFYVIIKGEADIFIPKNDLEITVDGQEASKIETLWTLKDYFNNNAHLNRTTLLNTDNAEPLDFEIDVSNLSAAEKLLFCAEDNSFSYYKDGVCLFKKINSLFCGDGFGELALLYNKSRAASVIAKTDLYLTKIHRDNYKKVFDLSIKTVEIKVGFLAFLFPSVPKETIAKLCYCIQEKPLTLHEKIYTQGSSADALYILRAGEVKVKLQILFVTHLLYESYILKSVSRKQLVGRIWES